MALGSGPLKTQAENSLSEFATKPDLLAPEEKMDLLTIITQLRRKIQLSGVMKQFVFAMASNSEREFRCNATIVLAEMAKTDQSAMNVLRLMADDSDDSVRRNAELFLARFR